MRIVTPTLRAPAHHRELWLIIASSGSSSKVRFLVQTTTEDAGREPRNRRRTGPAVFTAGFRPLFFLAALWAALGLPLYLAQLLGGLALPIAIGPVSWHGHEMLFGYLAAAIAGFLLTAIPNWTGRLPLSGWPLLSLALAWLAGRAAMATSAWIGSTAAAAADLIFLLILSAVVLREILAGRNWRNLPVGLAPILLLLANGLFHAGAAGLIGSRDIGLHLGIATVTLLIALIGGRIIPSFTRNWLAKQKAPSLPAAFGRFDHLTLAATLAALLAWLAVPQSLAAGLLAASAGLLNLLRLARWRGLAAAREPLLWALHLGYLWIPAGLFLTAASTVLDSVPPVAGIHALTVGAMATMTLAVMSRATLGHTGRPLRAGPSLTGSFCLITLAALTRLAASLAPGLFPPLIHISAAAWTAAFVLFLWVCGPMLLTRKPAE